MRIFDVACYTILVILIFSLFACNSSSNQENKIKIFHPPTEAEATNEMIQERQEKEKRKTALQIKEDYFDGVRAAQSTNKNIILIFAGRGVINSIKLKEEIILANEEIYSLMKDYYINVWLYTDSKRKISEKPNEPYKTIGEKWTVFQAEQFKGEYQPQIFILDPDGNKIEDGIGYEEAKKKLEGLLRKYKMVESSGAN